MKLAALMAQIKENHKSCPKGFENMACYHATTFKSIPIGNEMRGSTGAYLGGDSQRMGYNLTISSIVNGLVFKWLTMHRGTMVP